jgi:hypothetical protein
LFSTNHRPKVNKRTAIVRPAAEVQLGPAEPLRDLLGRELRQRLGVDGVRDFVQSPSELVLLLLAALPGVSVAPDEAGEGRELRLLDLVGVVTLPAQKLVTHEKAVADRS